MRESSLLVIALAGEGALALCSLDTASGELSQAAKTPLPGAGGVCRGMPLAADAEGRLIYAAWRGEPFRLFSFRFDAGARSLTCIGDAGLPASMCYAAMSSCGSHVLCASNQGSVISLSPVGAYGCAGEPVMQREAYKAHCLVEAPNGFVYATSLRGDFVQIYTFDGSRNDLAPVSRLELSPGGGPRHIIFTRDGRRAYLLSEFAGKLDALDVDPSTGALSVVHSVNLLSEDEKPWAAELRLGPAEDVIYASERRSSRIYAYAAGAEGLSLLCSVQAPAVPTAFGFAQSGRYLVALGETSGEAWTYRIAPDGSLELTNRMHVGAGPSWVLEVAT